MPRERWLITGASGQLGGHLLRNLAREVPAPGIVALARAGGVAQAGVEVVRLDLADAEGLARCVEHHRPTHLLHAGAMTSVADAHANPEQATRINTDATVALAEAATRIDARFLFCSTDMVFDGRSAPYRDTDPPTPLSHYGHTKASAERMLADSDRSLVVRLPLMYGFSRGPRMTTFAQQIAALREGRPLRLFTDEFRTPIWLADAASALVALARSEHTGVIHVAGPERLSRYEMAERFARLLGLSDARLVPASRLSIDSAEPRPADLSLDGSRFASLFPDRAPGAIRDAVFDEEP